jgi:hypothetical protein
MRPGPIRFIWRDGVLVPDGRRAAEYCDQFGEGEIIMMERHEERSTVSHNHYFASIKTAWENLPENDPRFPNPEALRHWALIKAGYCTESHVVCDTEEQANTIAGFMGHADGVIVVVKGNVVKKFTAKSQSVKAMNKQEFQVSKVAVLDIIAELIEVSRKRLESNAGRAA